LLLGLKIREKKEKKGGRRDSEAAEKHKGKKSGKIPGCAKKKNYKPKMGINGRGTWSKLSKQQTKFDKRRDKNVEGRSPPVMKKKVRRKGGGKGKGSPHNGKFQGEVQRWVGGPPLWKKKRGIEG